nr:MAG TPA: hypothetical protein [Bacteriophage sp.]DAR37163.1 MAG TPA: hypothetical protein [Caudoviricetes sp.]
MWCGFEPHISRALLTLEGIEPIGKINHAFLLVYLSPAHLLLTLLYTHQQSASC